MTKFILLLFLFSGIHSYGQKIQSLRLNDIQENTHIHVYRPIDRLKITLKTQHNSQILNKINIDSLEQGLSTNLDMAMDCLVGSLEPEDFISILAYDIRFKYYMNQRVSLTSRIFLTGVESQWYQYSLGLRIKF